MTGVAGLRDELVAAARQLNPLGINQGTSGNISVRDASGRDGAGMLITPSATPYDLMRPEQIAFVPFARPDDWQGPLKPSTEWPMHLGILQARPGIMAVVHTHAPYCTALSMLRRPIPPVHYMIALFGGDRIACAEYAPFGTQALADSALAAMGSRSACLLANHGMIVAGPTIAKALYLAVELEALARQYCIALTMGEPATLTETELTEAAGSLSGYGLAER